MHLAYEVKAESSALDAKALSAGPYWPSFEQFRVGGSAALDGVAPGTVATLRTKTGTYRILGDQDFQQLLGVASEIHRLRQGLAMVMQATKVFAQHKDRATEDLLMHAVSMLGDSPIFATSQGHGEFRLTQEEKEMPLDRDDDLNIKACSIPPVDL